MEKEWLATVITMMLNVTIFYFQVGSFGSFSFLFPLNLLKGAKSCIFFNQVYLDMCSIFRTDCKLKPWGPKRQKP